ncbi:MAG: helix-turn-helix transcriptional regulator [Bacteroidales bacterium]|nr:helix-turn-helix transcriptional regulator [Candidatus Colimorpha pelethequi]
MVNRINLLLQAKNITARQFAEEIGIQPSGMSHILSGRNNPSLDFVMKVVRRYPEIDINWLMFGKGEMYESGKGSSTSVSSAAPVSVSREPNVQTMVADSNPIPNSMGQQSMFDKPENNLFSEQQSVSVSQSVEKGIKQYGNASEIKETNLVREQNSYNPALAKPQSVVEPNRNSTQIGRLESSLPREVEQSHVASSLNVPQEKEQLTQDAVKISAPKGKRIVRLLAFYDDHTFGEYFPE